MKTKYYQLRERAEDFNSIGVIKSENGEFNIEQVERALTAHFDSEVENIQIEEIYGQIEVKFNLKYRDIDWEEIVDGEETWLYI